LLGLQQNRPFGALGGKESLCLFGLALSLHGKLSGTRGLFGQFGLTRHLGGFALSHADQTHLVHGHSGGVPPGDFGVFGCGAKLLQHRLLGGGGCTLALLVVKVLEAHLFSGSSRPGAEWSSPSGSRHIEVSVVGDQLLFSPIFRFGQSNLITRHFESGYCNSRPRAPAAAELGRSAATPRLSAWQAAGEQLQRAAVFSGR
jgi:hypothetical protein